MSQLHSLTRCLLAAGGATLDEDGMYLLYVESSALISKHWTGETFGVQELIANSVLDGSTAVYLITPKAKRIVCVSSSFLLRSRVYDEEDEEWTEESIGSHKVHPKGKIAGSTFEGGQQNVLFQDPSKRLVHLDSSWKPTILPANAAEGTPIVVSGDDIATYVFYVSADDNCLHCATREQGTGWSDGVFAAHAFVGDETPKRFLISQDDSGSFEAFILTQGNALLQIFPDGRKTSLGTVNSAGQWVALTKEQATVRVLPKLGRRPGAGAPSQKKDTPSKKPGRRERVKVIYFAW